MKSSGGEASMERINVTKSFLPPMDEYLEYVGKIWDSGQLTNQGPLLNEFESKMKTYLGVKHFHFVTNGTMALQIALRSLDIIEGEVITTPFSYVATVSSILWERCEPVFVDIDPDTFCIDPQKIEAAVTSKTRAIMPVHVFGNPCDVEAIEAIAKKHKLKVIYDAAHAFGVEYKGKALLSYGDASICSFHATKLFHTIEGGCVIVKDHDKKLSEQVELSKHFGHIGDEHYTLGINAKASEFHAAMGLSNLKYVDKIIAKRKVVSGWYDQFLKKKFQKSTAPSATTPNYAYYPVVFDSEAHLHKVLAKLNAQNIFPRRYFYPSLNKLPYLKGAAACPISEDISVRIACLPLYGELEKAVVEKIAKIVNEA